VQFPPDSPAAAEHWAALSLLDRPMSHPVYPTQIMEALGETIIFFFLLYFRSRKRFHGQVILTYFFLYAALRAIMEIFRGDPIRGFVFKWPAQGDPIFLSTSQAVSILVAIGGAIATFLIVRARSKSDASATASARAA
jgi:prolipoprotein diacylglyceryltransferase